MDRDDIDPLTLARALRAADKDIRRQSRIDVGKTPAQQIRELCEALSEASPDERAALADDPVYHGCPGGFQAFTPRAAP